MLVFHTQNNFHHALFEIQALFEFVHLLLCVVRDKRTAYNATYYTNSDRHAADWGFAG
jgi:hypothetical protein